MEENGDKQRELKRLDISRDICINKGQGFFIFDDLVEPYNPQRIRTKLTLFFKLSKNQKDYIMRKLNNA